jgi:uncharacterized protein
VSEPNGYPTGVPCWVDAWRPDPEGAVAFYREIFGWEAENRAGSGASPYYVCTLNGRDVAAIGSAPAADLAPDWNTYVRVDDVEASTSAVLDAGGRIVVEPYDAHDGGRRVIVADPAGATFGLWQLGTSQGAQVVNAPGAWAMSILNTAATDDATRFYGAVLGWTTSTFDMGDLGLTMWHLPGYLGGEPDQPVPRDVVAVMMPAADGTAAHWGVNFWASDANHVAATTAELGGSVVEPPIDRPPFRETVVTDPDGATIAVSQLVREG